MHIQEHVHRFYGYIQILNLSMQKYMSSSFGRGRMEEVSSSTSSMEVVHATVSESMIGALYAMVCGPLLSPCSAFMPPCKRLRRAGAWARPAADPKLEGNLLDGVGSCSYQRSDD